MDAVSSYFNRFEAVLEKVRTTQAEALRQGARMMADASLQGHNIFTFGCSHAGLLALEMYYRTGGMANINPVRAPGLHLDIDPATMTSQMERMDGYGRIIIDNLPLGKDDLIIIHSVSGRNNVPVDAAIRAREKGAKVICLTNLSYSRSVASRHPSGKHLFEVSDLVLDNCGVPGDACLDIPSVPEKVGPTSTAVGAAMLNAMMCQAVDMIVQDGGMAPILMSANLDGGDEHNEKVFEKYGSHIFYMK